MFDKRIYEDSEIIESIKNYPPGEDYMPKLKFTW